MNDCATLREGEGVEAADRDPACFSVRRDDSSRNVTEKGAECTSAVEDANEPAFDVERALAKALESAATAGRFDVVAQLAKELEARRLARLGNVVVLPAKIRRGGK